MRLGDGDGGPDVVALVEVGTVGVSDDVTEGVDGGNLAGIGPGGERSDVEDRGGELELGHMLRVELPSGHGEASVDAVGTLVGADGVTLGGVADGADDGTADHGVGVAPRHGDGVDAERIRVGR